MAVGWHERHNAASSATSETDEWGRIIKAVAVLDERDPEHPRNLKAEGGTWYRATISVDENKQVTASFDYESKPYGEDEEGSAEVIDLLTQDHELFPRDLEHLPDWHPAKHIAM